MVEAAESVSHVVYNSEIVLRKPLLFSMLLYQGFSMKRVYILVVWISN
jgi:hypothetical protein